MSARTRRATLLEGSCDCGTNLGAWKDILEKAPGTVFRLVRKSCWILLISRANFFLVVQRRTILVVTVGFLHHQFAARAISNRAGTRQILDSRKLLTATKRTMKLDPYRKQRGIQLLRPPGARHFSYRGSRLSRWFKRLI